jgi:catechol 2,3-dioxygenase-like lactoylglutathione lyase family enzyme
MALEGETTVEGPWADRVVGLKDVRADIAMMRTPDGHGQVELSRFHAPAAVRFGPQEVPSNTLGMRRIMFAVDDLDGTLAQLRPLGASLVDEVAQYEDKYRLCFVRGPEGIVVGLAEELG